MEILTCERLNLRTQEHSILHDVNLAVRPGELHILWGPNGSGKTMLLNCITQFVPPTSGGVWLAGREITTLPPDVVARMGVGRTFQTPHNFGSRRVVEAVLASLRSNRRADRASRSVEKQDVRSVLAALGIARHEQMLCKDLSWGTQRLVDIAVALCRKPRVLLLDEPLAGMSPAAVARIAGSLKALLEEGVAIMVASHMTQSLDGAITAVHVLDAGRIVRSGPPSVVLNADRDATETRRRPSVSSEACVS